MTTRRQAPPCPKLAVRWLSGVCLAVCLLSGADGRAAASPAPVAEAKALFKAGLRAYQAGRFPTAVQAFDQAYDLVPRPELRFSAAQALRRQHTLDPEPRHLHKAKRYYEQYLAEVAQGGRRLDAVKALEEINGELAAHAPRPPPEAEGGGAPTEATPPPPPPAPDAATTLMVDTPAPEATVRLDGGEPIPVPLIRDVTPGEHRVRIEAPGFQAIDRTVLVPKGRLKSLDLELDEVPSRLTIAGDDGAEVVIDGRPVGATPVTAPILLSSGEHRVVVGLNGYEPHSETIELARGERHHIDVDMDMTAQRIAAWILTGFGSAVAVGGGVLLGAAAVERRQAQDLYDLKEEEQRALAEDEVEAFNSALERRDNFSRGAAVALSVGGVGLGLGLVLYLLDEPRLYGPVAAQEQQQEPGKADHPAELEARFGPLPTGGVTTTWRLRF